MPEIKKRNTPQISSTERSILISCAAIMGAFVLFVCIATSMSLALYTFPFAALTLIVVVDLLFGIRYRVLSRVVMGVGILGALAALWLVAAYLPLYSQHLEYMNNLK